MARENVQTDDNEGEDLEPTPYQNNYRRNLAIDDDSDESDLQDPADMQTTRKDTEGLAQTKASKEQTHDFKKRYGDLKRHYDTKLNEWKQEKEMFQAKLAVEAKKHDIKKLPKTEEELESFKEKYPDVYDVVETISALQASDRVKDIEGRLEELRYKEQEAVVQTAEKQLLNIHPDFVDLKENENFLNWLTDQPTNISDGIFKNNTDVKWAARVVALFKADIGAPRNTKRANQKANKPPKSSSPKNKAAQAVTRTTANRSLDSFQDDTKIWSIAEISRLKPKEYELLEKEIDKAVKEGRVVDSVE